MSKLIDAMRAKYPSPQAALRAMGLDVSLLEGPRLARDEQDASLRPLLLALRAKARSAKVDTDGHSSSYQTRWPNACRIEAGY